MLYTNVSIERETTKMAQDQPDECERCGHMYRHKENCPHRKEKNPEKQEEETEHIEGVGDVPVSELPWRQV